MRQRKFQMFSAGTPQWERKVAINESLRVMAYRTTQVARLTFEDDRVPLMCRFEVAGTDEMDEKGKAVTGWGKGSIQELESGDQLFCQLRWFQDADGNYAGEFTISSGSGRWKGAIGEIEIQSMFLTTIYEEDDLSVDQPMQVMGMLEGIGTISLPA